MKEKEVTLAKMIEKKSQYGNIYYEGKTDFDARYVMRKVNQQGKKVWQLFLVS
jgi:hypothetical protein